MIQRLAHRKLFSWGFVGTMLALGLLLQVH